MWLRYWREGSLRREVCAQALTFRTGVTVLLREPSNWPRMWFRLTGFMALIVRGDGIEISSQWWPIRVVLGEAYYFRAREMTIQVRRDPARPYEPKWIVVTGRQGGQQVKLAISKENAYQVCRVWSALVGAGAVPDGPPPPDRPGTGRWAPPLYDY